MLTTTLNRIHPTLWMIEANATYRGWFVGGNQQGEWGNKEFVTTHIAGHGELGRAFVTAKADVKMGDTPTVARLLRGRFRRPHQSQLGRQIRSYLGWPQNGLQSIDNRVGHGRSLWCDGVHVAVAKRLFKSKQSGIDLRRNCALVLGA